MNGQCTIRLTVLKVKLKCASNRIPRPGARPESQRSPSRGPSAHLSNQRLGLSLHGSHVNSGRVSSPFPQPLPPRPRQPPLGEAGGLASQLSLALRPGNAGRTPRRRPEPTGRGRHLLPPPGPNRHRRHRGTRPHLSSQSLHFTCSGTSCWNRTWLMLDRRPLLCETSNQPSRGTAPSGVRLPLMFEFGARLPLRGRGKGIDGRRRGFGPRRPPSPPSGLEGAGEGQFRASSWRRTRGGHLW